jgi:pimeloyl-ACP methyl ester carboxylesterase
MHSIFGIQIDHRSLALIRLRSVRIFVLFVALPLTGAPLGHAQVGISPASDANLSHPTDVVTAKRDGYTISGLVTHLQGAKTFKHAIVLFPGYPGIMRLGDENGQPRFELRGNFLVRSRRHWLDAETLVVVVDAPSDQWATFTQQFREGPRYGADVEALLKEIGHRYNVENWTFVGTSEGSVSAFHASRMNPLLARRTILTASLFLSSRNGSGLSAVTWAELSAELLWVHHEDDPCAYTSYRDAREFSQRTRKPLLTVRGGGPGRGAACAAFTAHGFVGVERETVIAMLSWVKTGLIPADVKP